MKRNHWMVLSVLTLSLASGAAQATFPSDAEASYDLPALETHADRYARVANGGSDEAWGVSKREVQPHNAFPFGGGQIDD